MWEVIALFALFFIPGLNAAENPHCVSDSDGYGAVVTACDNGTVTVVKGRAVIVCNKGINGSTNCYKEEL